MAAGVRRGRPPLNVDRDAVIRDRSRGQSLTQIGKAYRISKASVIRVLRSDAREGTAA